LPDTIDLTNILVVIPRVKRHVSTNIKVFGSLTVSTNYVRNHKDKTRLITILHFKRKLFKVAQSQQILLEGVSLKRKGRVKGEKRADELCELKGWYLVFMVRTDSLREIPFALLSKLPLFFSQSHLSEIIAVFIIRIHVLVLFLLIFCLIILSFNLLFFFHISVLVEIFHQAEKFRTEVF
jgi:hypothetical protein